MNQVTLIGRLTKDVEVRSGQNGKSFAKITIAIDRHGKDKETDFPRVTVFGTQAENLAKYQGKGSLIAIEGHITTGNYQKDGETVYTTDIIADRIEFLSWNNKESEAY